MRIIEEKEIFPTNTLFTTLSPKSATHIIHSHDFYELFYIVSGTVTHVYNSTKQELSLSNCIIIKPGDAHEFKNENKCTLRNLLFTKDLYNDLKHLLSITAEVEKDLFGKVFHLSTQQISSCEKKAINFSKEQNIHIKNLLGINILCDILTQILSKKIHTNTNHPKIIDDVLEYLNRDFYLKDCTKKLNLFGYNRSYLSTKFKQCTGVSITDYLTDVRLNYAVYYLKNTNFTLSEIIDKIGIESLSYFNKIFKEKYNISPIKFRKTNDHTS